MARIAKPLTQKEIENTKPGTKDKKLFDGGGLFLLVKSSGSKGWRLKYHFGGKEKLLSLGSYPRVTLKDARLKSSETKDLIDQGIDPMQRRIANKQHQREIEENTFEKLSEFWLKNQTDLADSTKRLIERRLERDILPAIGRIPVTQITPKQILDAVVRPMERRGAGVLSRRVKSIISQVFCAAVAEGLAQYDPTSSLTRALQKVIRGHRAAITDPEELAPLLRAVDGYDGSAIVRAALQLLPLVFARPGELRAMRWQDIDPDAKEWRYTAPKTGKEIVVPLARQSIEILEALRPLTGHMELCFPSIRSTHKPMSDNTLNAAFRRLGYDKETVSAHGFRATFRTIAAEVLQQRFDLMEHQLGHVVKDANGEAYNRTKFLPERHKMMQQWANYLDGLKAGAKVIPLHRARG